MNALPNDPSDWPTDPFELLGLERQVTLKDARRAYFNLLRTYKPDQFPVEFQKINEAHSQVRSMLDSGQQYTPTHRVASPIDINDGSADKTTELDESTARAFWDFAEEEDWEKVDQVLKGIPPEHRREVWDFRLAEYYLRRCSADRDSLTQVHQRIALLCKLYLPPQRRHLIARELSSELEAFPAAATSPALNQVVANANDEDGNFYLIQMRWRALNVENAESIIEDMEILSTRQAHLMSSWYSLIAESLIYTVWNKSKVSKQYTRDYRDLLNQDANRAPANISLLDLMFFARKEWRSAQESGDVAEWLKATPYSSSFAESHLRSIWLPIAVKLNQTRKPSLKRLDAAFRSYPAYMSLFSRGLERVVNRVDDRDFSATPNDIDQQLYAFWRNLKNKTYKKARDPMLQFCCNNQIWPRTLSQFADRHLSNDATTWTEVLSKDNPFWCVYYASVIANARM